MATEKILIFDEAGNAKRMKVRIARFLDNEPVTSSDKENIRETLGVDDSLSGTFTTPLSVTSANDSSFTGGGKVGIGGSPTYELDVQAANARIAATSSAGIVNHLQADNTAAYVGPLSNHALVIKTNNTERMRIKSDGKFAFGHSSPNAEFSIKGDTEFLDGDTGTRIGLLYDNGTEGIFELRDNNTTKVSLRSAGNSSLTGGGLGVGADPGSTVMRVSGGSGQLFKVDDGGDALLVCDATGEVGVGVSDPNAKLHVSDESAPTLRLSRTGTGQIWQQSIDSNGRLIWQEAASEGGTKYTRAVLDDDGRLGIGISSPDKALTVKAGTINTTIARLTGANNDRGLVIGTSANGITNDATVEYDAVSASTAGQHVFKTDGTTRWTINSSGNLVANSTGIDFGSGANTTISDYEVSDHTASGTPAGGAISFYSNNNTLKAVKVGSLVSVTGRLMVQTSSATGAYLDISLPYVVGDYTNVGGNTAAVTGFYDSSAATYNVAYGTATEGNSSFRVRLPSFEVNDEYYVNLTYHTTA